MNKKKVQCKNSIELRATPDRLTSVRKGIWKNLGNGLFAGSLSAASGGWQTGLIGLGLTVGGGAVADAWHPNTYRIRFGLDGQWQEFPAEPTIQPWNDLRIHLQIRATDLGGKVAEAIVEEYPECSAYLPLPNNRNYVYVFALRNKQSEDVGKHKGDEDQPHQTIPTQSQSQSTSAHPSSQASATNNNANNISVTINNSRPRRVSPQKTHTPSPPGKQTAMWEKASLLAIILGVINTGVDEKTSYWSAPTLLFYIHYSHSIRDPSSGTAAIQS
ncbi:MAG: hypothetical protein KBD66_04015 [Candidatus Doudnabacteria bacterium]|nr:hypothetical protein [Candidatus Doudnabacteria bacterium]